MCFSVFRKGLGRSCWTASPEVERSATKRTWPRHGHVDMPQGAEREEPGKDTDGEQHNVDVRVPGTYVPTLPTAAACQQRRGLDCPGACCVTQQHIKVQRGQTSSSVSQA